MANSPTVEALYRVKRALVSHISYLAACETNAVFSEYILYETVYRALCGQSFTTKCEVPCIWEPRPANCDWKRLDFCAEKPNSPLMAIEVKWVKSTTTRVQKDLLKLTHFLDHYSSRVGGSRAFLCLFGKLSKIRTVRPAAFCAASVQRLSSYPRVEVGNICTANLGRTKFSYRIFEVKRQGARVDSTREWNPL